MDHSDYEPNTQPTEESSATEGSPQAILQLSLLKKSLEEIL